MSLDNQRVYITNEVAEILNISIGSVRNYAKSLERSGHSFSMRKQARLWTSIELNLVKSALDLYNTKDYPLDLCFQYIVKLHHEGQDEADKLINNHTPAQTTEPSSPQIDYLEGIQNNTNELINMMNEFKTHMPTKQMLLENQTNSNEHDKRVEELQEIIETLKDDKLMLGDKVKELENELKHVKTLNVFSFNKWKRDNT